MNKDRKININLTATEFDRLNKLAVESNLNFSSFVRYWLKKSKKVPTNSSLVEL